MAPTYSKMKSQLQTTVDELEQYKAINKSLQDEVETHKWLKEWRDNENRRLWNQNRQLERTISYNKKILSNQDKEISCLKIHNQNLEYEIRKSKNDNKSPYGCDNELEEEIKHLNKLIMEKDVELAQVQMKLENQETELRHHKHRKEKLQQQYDDSKKTHKLELKKVNKVLSSNTEEISQL